MRTVLFSKRTYTMYETRYSQSAKKFEEKRLFPRWIKIQELHAVYAIFIVLLMFLGSFPASAEEREGSFFNIKFAILFDGQEPIVGTTKCPFGKKCTVADHKNPTIKLYITAYPTSSDNGDDLIINCEPSNCSFSTWRSTFHYRGQRKFDIYDKLSDGVEVPLVLPTRNKIGKILLIY